MFTPNASTLFEPISKLRATMNRTLAARRQSISRQALISTCICTLALCPNILWAEDLLHKVQMRRLHQPQAMELASEERGRVYIYSGLKDHEVEQAIDTEFDRVENMMFVRTVVTDNDGNIARDAEDEILFEDDGCD